MDNERTAMPVIFAITIKTSFGSTQVRESANDELQIARCMPSQVVAYRCDAICVADTADAVSDERLEANLSLAISTFERAAAMDAVNDAEKEAAVNRTLRALGALQARIRAAV